MIIKILDSYVNNPGDLHSDPLMALNDLGAATFYERTSADQLPERIADVEIAVTSKVAWDKATLDLAPHLKMIALTSTGYNVVDLDEANRRNIVVSNVPAYATPDVVQMVFALMFELSFHIAEHAQGVREGQWIAAKDFSYWNRPLIEVDKKVLGIIGMGSIGQAVAHVAQALGMNVLFHSRTPRPEFISETCQQVSFDEVLAGSDFVSLHCPATADTVELIDAEAIAKMKDGAYLINTARGVLLNEQDVADALQSGKLAGAGLDVVAHEPMLASNPLRLAPNTVITPHIAWAAIEARERLLNTVLANVKAFIEGHPQNVVN